MYNTASVSGNICRRLLILLLLFKMPLRKLAIMGVGLSLARAWPGGSWDGLLHVRLRHVQCGEDPEAWDQGPHGQALA
ncbi:uncharacterized protein J3R85_012687 [Psidium guajava]|nr:uncharacterized protein J3R85_012687 [Psidium guajava]